MSDSFEHQFEEALIGLGNSLAPGLGFVLGDYIGSDALELDVSGVRTLPSDEANEEIPARGLLVTHSAKLAQPRDEAFDLTWIFDESALQNIDGAKLNDLAAELADTVASDKYSLESSSAQASEDCQTDFLSTNVSGRVSWLCFDVKGLDVPMKTWLAWPRCALERMYGPNDGLMPAEVEESSTAEVQETEASPPPPAAKPISEGVRRVLKTKVPIVVTLANKDLPANGLFDIGPGTIIEFERGCEEPLILSVNNLPIGLGEAVKVGDHFGLKVTAILSPQERAVRIGGKWRFG